MTSTIEPVVGALRQRCVGIDERTGRRIWEDDLGSIPTVTDNAAYAWRDSSEFCLDRLPADFVYDHRVQLDAAGIPAMELELAVVWAEHGYLVQWVSEQQMESSEDRTVPAKLQWAMWAEAAGRIDETALVAAAELNDELNGYREPDPDRWNN